MNSTIFSAEPGKQEVSVTQVFDAPRDLVYQTYTNPKFIPEWWGPGSLTTTVESMDLRPGGLWRFVQQDGEGHVYAFHGFYHVILPPERLVFTFEYEGEPGHVLLETLVFKQLEGSKTRLTDTSVFQTVEDRDGMLKAGMETGSTESMDRFAALLAKLIK
jgi:uncharacterized protein YndB with AHSA1/START domain